MKKMGMGSWIVVGALSGLLVLTGITAFKEWTLDQSITIPSYGYAAIILGILISVAVGVGLMALIFYSSRYGYDEPPQRLRDGDDPR
jgi:hypothetical protein